MATRLDQQIELLEDIVERCLDLCDAAWNGTRCVLPRNHAPASPHKFLIEIRRRRPAVETHMSLQVGRASKNHTEHKIVNLEEDGFSLK